MSYNYATRDVPFLRDYAAAFEHEAKVLPIRGRATEIKPLGSRKKDYSKIHRAANGDIQILWSDTPVITFRPDGYIEVTGVTYSSSQGVQDRVLSYGHGEPRGVNICTHDGNPWIAGVLAPCDPHGDRRGAFPLRKEGENLFRREADGYLRYVNPLYPTQHVVKRKEMNAVRKKYPDFRKFAHGMIKLQGNGEPMTQEFMASMWGSGENQLWQNDLPFIRHPTNKPNLRIHYPNNRTEPETLAMIESGDTAKWADAVTYLCWTHQRWNTLWDLKTFEAALRLVLTVTHADTVFEEKTITTGAWVKNPNRNYLRP
jgi:hypothetical protein